jgi:hypothetical protein
MLQYRLPLGLIPGHKPKLRTKSSWNLLDRNHAQPV